MTKPSLRHFQMIVFTAVFICLTIILTPITPHAEVVRYRINAVLADAPTWPYEGTCAHQVSTPGSTAQMDIIINEPIIPSAGLICEPECTISTVVLEWSIAFNDSDDCAIDNSMIGNPPVRIRNGEASTSIPTDRMDALFSAFTECLEPYNAPFPDPSRTYLCNWFGTPGDPTNSYILEVRSNLLHIEDTSATWFDTLPTPATLTHLIQTNTYPPASIRIGIFDPVTLSVKNIDFTAVAVTILTDPTTLIVDLIDATSEINASIGIVNSLDAKLDSAVDALADARDNNDVSAVNKLEAFKNAVEAQRGNHISDDDADNLITTAQEIIDMLSAQ